MLDFAVNVRGAAPPRWLLDKLAARLPDLGHYPSQHDVDAATAAVGARHGRRDDNVMLLAGATEAFSLLPNLRPRLAAVIAPSFTEPDAALTAASVPITHVVVPFPFGIDGAEVPDEADLVVVGNPTNPTSVLHPREHILRLRRDGRIVVVDEAFADAIPGEPESLSCEPLPDVLVLRSLTKTWALPGLRVGYALGAPAVLRQISATRPHWPLGTLQLEALTACSQPNAVAAAEEQAAGLVEMRSEMAEALAATGVGVVDGVAPFVLFEVPDAHLARKCLAAKGIAIRRCDTFIGLEGQFLRAAVRPEWPTLVSALAEVLT
jgi:histidinol-phosphate aminotransferase